MGKFPVMLGVNPHGAGLGVTGTVSAALLQVGCVETGLVSLGNEASKTLGTFAVLSHQQIGLMLARLSPLPQPLGGDSHPIPCLSPASPPEIFLQAIWAQKFRAAPVLV